MTHCPIPKAEGPLGLKVLRGLLRERSLLAAMRLMHDDLGDLFQITLPGFKPVVGAGPDFNRQVLIDERDKFSWRGESDPVVKLLRHGVLVVDNEEHDRVRQQMEPALRRSPTLDHIPAMLRYTDQVIDAWPQEGEVDMLVEMRKAALLILMGTLYGTDFSPQLESMWHAVIKTIEYISPGPWILWPNMPRPGFKKALQQMDDYLYALIRERREKGGPEEDLLGQLLQADLADGLIRDQLLTMLIAGHDTSTAMLAWSLLLLGQHPQELARATAEVDTVCGRENPAAEHLNQLNHLNHVIKEALRLYPPIHVGNRFAAEDVTVQGYNVPEKTRVMLSIYLSHRDKAHWDNPDQFCPARFERGQGKKRPSLAYIPFGGGPRNCIGAIYAQIEGQIVLARILQKYELELVPGQKIRPYMGATLEPRPGVRMRVTRRD